MIKPLSLLTGIATLLVAWLLLGGASSPLPPALPAVLGGLGFAIAYTAGPPLLYLRLDAATCGRMLGFFFMLQQLSLMISSLAVGALHDSPRARGAASRSATGLDFLAAGEALALVLAIALAVLDRCQEPTTLAAEEEEAARKDAADAKAA